MKNWLGEFDLQEKKTAKFFQMGGEGAAPADPGMAADPAAGGDPAMDPAAQPGGDPGADFEAMIGEYAQTRDPELAVQIADMLVEMVGGAGAPAGGDPMAGGEAPAGPEAAPAMAGGGYGAPKAPVFRRGGSGRVSRR